jgi:4-diphosphocytidyl-2-C-methyl-D-erythritol kinase
MRVILRASAKINLDLQVHGRRADGYHEVRTVLQGLDLHDTVVVERTRGAFVLEGDAALMPLDRTNLVWRGADALWRAAGRPGDPRGARVQVTKRIPAQAGLGGGSSDAAAALLGLGRLWRLPATLDFLAPVAAALGADVPFFLIGGAALGLGRGEVLYPLVNLPPRVVLLVLPGFGVSTPDAYRWLAEARFRGRRGTLPGRKTADPVTAWRPSLGRNELEGPVEVRHPEIREIRERLAAGGAEVARMSGSGSAVFGLFASERTARRAAADFADRGFRVLLTRTRPRSSAESRRLA